MKIRPFLAMPVYGGIEPEAVTSLLMNGAGAATVAPPGHALLGDLFNKLWCEALNSRETHGWTHFAMCHADVGAEFGWLEKLIAEQQRVGADVLSAVIPLKMDTPLDQDRPVSTATITNNRHHRMTLGEVYDLPVTFCAADVPCDVLLVNTGLWVCDFTKPWVEPPNFTGFNVYSCLAKNADGTFSHRNRPEDWDASLQWHKLGLKVYATRLVEVGHVGRKIWKNRLQEASA